MKKIVFALTTLFATMGAAQAQGPASPPLHFLAGLGVSGGGDDLATARYTNGSSDNIKAGGGVYFTALESRFQNTCCKRFGSPRIGGA